MSEAVKTSPMNGSKAIEAVTDDQPVFDFSRTSYQNARQFARWSLEISHLTKQIQNAAPETDIVPMLDKQDALQTLMEQHIMGVVAHLPRSWLVTGAPEDINWREPEALQYLRSDKFMQLMDAAVEAQNAKN